MTKEQMLKLPSEKRREFAFRPPRDRTNDMTVLKAEMKKIRTPEYRKRMEYDRPPGQHRFYLLPEHQRDDATKYFESLCFRHKDRIAIKPRFVNVLHMITLNKFKNPNQTFEAARIVRYKKFARRGFLRNLSRLGNLAARKEYSGPRSAVHPT